MTVEELKTEYRQLEHEWFHIGEDLPTCDQAVEDRKREIEDRQDVILAGLSDEDFEELVPWPDSPRMKP